jgi:predicted nucleotidyltransferase
MIQLPQDFKEFLRLLKEHKVKYLLIGGYAVSYHGYPRSTADMDIWVAVEPNNADNLVAVLREFGFDVPKLESSLFLNEDKVIRMGLPPLRIELLTTISGVSFDECYSECVVDTIDGIEVNIISLKHLKINKKASGRYKDLDDLDHLGS